MKVIWKFTINPFEGGRVQMPKGANVIHVHEQNDNIRLWAECDVDLSQPAHAVTTRQFHIIPTGNEAPDAEYIGSVHIKGQDQRMYVFHVYDGGEPVEPLTVDTLRAELADIEGCLESTSPSEVVGYFESGNYAAALELLERDYHVQLSCGNAGRADAIHQVIRRIGDTWQP